MQAVGNVKRVFIAGSMATVVCLILAGCPSTVDGPASAFSARVVVLDVVDPPAQDGKVVVVMQFSQNGTAVELASSIVVTCNGVPLTQNDLVGGRAERIPIQPVGGRYSFVFSREGVNTTANVTVPARPVFMPPTIAGAALARSSSFTIRYVAGGGTSVYGDASDATKSENNSQADDGTHDGLDVSGFTHGPGRLSVKRILERVLTGTGFASAATRYETTKKIAITWL
jgi:hypothetical protein